MANKRTTAITDTKKKIIVAALSVLFVLLVAALIVNLVRLSAANARKNSLAEQNAKLEQIIESNESMINFCGSSEFVEEYAREMLDMIYRGETVIGAKQSEENKDRN